MEHLEGAKQYPDQTIYCNCCGRVINVSDKGQETMSQARKVWSYLSADQTLGHSFNMCLSCYEKMISSFKIPVEECLVVDDMPSYSDEEIEQLNAAYAAELCK